MTLLTKGEVERYCGITAETMDRWIADGAFPPPAGPRGR
jgi:predicted DNA-binding transcriptional regulator AlpA